MLKELLYFITILSVFLLAAFSKASVISPSAQELEVSFQAEFYTERYRSVDVYELVSEHYQHLFGYFHSPAIIRYYKHDPNRLGGIGAPQMPMTVESKPVAKKSGDGYVITYEVKGKILLQNKIAQSVLAAESWKVALPYDLDNFYDEACTDTHYNSIDDFWYFYDAFRPGCEKFRKSPLAKEVTLNFRESRTKIRDNSPRLDLLRADNANGEVFQITTMNGFADDSKDGYDEGRRSFLRVNNWLKSQGFSEKIVNRTFTRPVYQYEKQITAKNGKSVLVRITRLLAETSITSRNVTFAKFFKKAIEEADVLIYAGHSGLGGNLDIASLEEKAGSFEFNPKKRQIFFFDSCSSYSYYLAPFSEQKSKSKLDVMTNGLSSYFSTESDQTSKFLEILFNLDRNPTWMEVLREMESTLRGSTYLLNVGSV